VLNLNARTPPFPQPLAALSWGRGPRPKISNRRTPTATRRKRGLEKLKTLANAVKRNGSWDFAVFVPKEKGFNFDFERVKKNKRYINAFEAPDNDGYLVLIKAANEEDALKRLSTYLTVESKRKALKWLEGKPIKRLGKETLRFGRFQLFREHEGGKLRLSYNKRYLKELERTIRKVCHKRHNYGARRRDVKELVKYLNQIVRRLRAESRYLWIPAGQMKGFNRELRKNLKEALVSMYGFKPAKVGEYLSRYLLLWVPPPKNRNS
jgi:hypothetical protein